MLRQSRIDQDADEPSGDRIAHAVTNRGRAWLQALILIAYTAWALFGFGNRLDYHHGDEALYFEQGRRLWDGEPTPGLAAWSPLLTTLYGALDRIVPAPLHPTDVVYCGSVLGSAVALLWALRVLLPGAIALLLAAAWASSATLLHHDDTLALPSCYAFASVFAFLAVGAMARRRPVLGSAWLLVGLFERSEYVAWAGAFALALALALLRRRARWRELWPIAAIAIGFAGWMAISAAHRERAWFAFAQHYSVGDAALAEEHVGLDAQLRVMAAFQHYEPANRDFPQQTSVLGALWHHPAKFAGHVTRNAAGTPSALLSLIGDRFTWWPALAWSWRIFAMTAAVLALVFARRQVVALLLEWPTPVTLLMLTTVGMVAAALVVWPHPKLLYPCVVPLSAALGLTLAALRNRFGQVGRHATLAACIAFLAAGVAGPRPFPRYPQPRLLRDAVQVIQSYVPAGAADVFALRGEALPIYARRYDLIGHEPRLEHLGSLGGVRTALGSPPPIYLLLHIDAAQGFPATAAELLVFAIENRYRLIAFTPRCLLFRR